MSSKNPRRNFIASLPVEKILTGALNVMYAWAKSRGDYITQLACHPEFGRMRIEDLKDLQMKAVRQSFAHHYKNCEAYRRICGDDPREIKKVEDIWGIPQIHAEEFKKGGILSIPKNRIYTVATTSGTSGSVSYLPKDMISQLRMGIEGVHLVLNIYHPLLAEYTGRTLAEARKHVFTDAVVHVFSPPPGQSSSWLVKGIETVLPLVRILGVDVNFLLKGFKFDPEEVLKTIKETNRENKMMLFAGFHYVFTQMMDYMDEIGETLELDPTGENMCVIALVGGWKTLTGGKIDKKIFPP